MTALPTTHPDPACGRCRFFARLQKSGECRYHPPTSRSAEPWPFVEPTDFCGKFEPKSGTGGLQRIQEG